MLLNVAQVYRIDLKVTERSYLVIKQSYHNNKVANFATSLAKMAIFNKNRNFAETVQGVFFYLMHV